ncbi:MAG: MalY/PatB family protein [Thomasclavelia sp.]|uniref:MalY/PatB family protein n=1 Tax=Thomasclavelia sp. TaxID=3025757 RepID=UPI0039A28930
MYDFSKMTNRKNSSSLKWNIKAHELPMWVADMDFETAPEIIEALHQRVDHGIFGYDIVPDEYFESIQNWWYLRHNYKIKKEWLMFCTGVVPAISSIIRKVTNIGENILIQSPVYNIFYNSISNNGRHILSSDLVYDGAKYYIDFEDLEQKLALPQTTLMILCNPHNPIGKIWDRETLRQIGNLCAKYHVIVLSDEIHCDITAPQKEYIPFASVSTTNLMISITCISPSKAFNLAGLQSACIIVADPLLRHKVNRGINTDEVAEPNSFAIQATISAFNKGGYWLDELREYLENNKKRAVTFINENLPMIHVINSEATYLLWIDCSKVSCNSADLVKVIRASTGLYLSDGSEYGENGRGFIRMNIACSQTRLDDGLQRFKEGILIYQRRKIKMNQKFIKKMHQFEDIINLEGLYHKTTEEIIKQYIYQRGEGHNDQGFNLTNEELDILDILIQI